MIEENPVFVLEIDCQPLQLYEEPILDYSFQSSVKLIVDSSLLSPKTAPSRFYVRRVYAEPVFLLIEYTVLPLVKVHTLRAELEVEEYSE